MNGPRDWLPPEVPEDAPIPQPEPRPRRVRILLSLIVTVGVIAAVSSTVNRIVHHSSHSNPVPVSTSSGNWAGYDTTGSTFSSVSADWTQPIADCNAKPDSRASFWVGLDGAGAKASTVEQIGTSADCIGGVDSYYAWYEFYPSDSVPDRTHILNAGDQIHAEVDYNSSGQFFSVLLQDTTQGWELTSSEYNSSSATSAEVIAEIPQMRSGEKPLLTSFSSLTFSSAQVNGQPLETFQTDRISLTAGSQGSASVSDFADSGNFTVTEP